MDQMFRSMDRWMNDLRFYFLSISISVISGQRTGDNERLCTMKPRLQQNELHRWRTRTARSVGMF